ncbi:site-specific integrase [Polynucleobacter sp. MWH-UH23A]|uniref:tyrosine-type recombinase/integrase n=1 Tax=Polynucleobacter sp. MWH-UH23A TaxID=1855613 RepID=UPI003364D981
MLFKDAVVAYQKNYSGKDASQESRLAFWVEQLGNYEVQAITALDIDDSIGVLMQRPAQTCIRKKIGQNEAGEVIYEVRYRDLDRPKSEATLNRYIAALGSVFRFIKKMRLIRGFISPISGVEKFKESQGRLEFMTEGEVELLIAKARSSRWKKLACLIRIAFVTGVRSGALKAMRWKHINWELKTITFPITKNGEPHTAPLNEACIEELLRIFSDRCGMEDLVFCGKFRSKAHDFRSSYMTLIHDLFPGRDLNFHSLRHSCCSHLAKKGVPLPVIAAWMTHKSLRMVSRYSHISTADRENYLRSAF